MNSRRKSTECLRQGALLFCVTVVLSLPIASQTQLHSVVCHEGSGVFNATLSNDVTVHVGAARQEGLSKRACAARLSRKQQELAVEAEAVQIDLDAFGVNFGTGTPAAAFQIKKSDADCCMEYRIYSLGKPFRLLRTITGAGFFSASDVDLDGQIEIWASDAGAVDNFEGLHLGEIDVPPLVVFRLANDRLVDVSAEFQPYFDQEIAGIREEILAGDAQDFKSSNGKLTETVTPASADRLHRLRRMKIMALEIVWAYLYSGRQEEAWHALAEFWPPSDLERIRAAILKARALGIHREADDTALSPPSGKKKQARIFDIDKLSAEGHPSGLTPPKAIQLELQPVAGSDPPKPPDFMLLELVIDAAGKVRSADPAGPVAYPRNWIEMAFAWKFIPAFRDGQAVASRMRLSVSPKQ